MKNVKKLKGLLNIVPVTIAAISINIAKMRADSLFAKTGKRFYVVWDGSRRKLVCISYDAIPGRADSYRYLRLRGCFPPQTRQQIKNGSLYYSRSKSHPAMPKDIFQARLWTLVALRKRKKDKNQK